MPTAGDGVGAVPRRVDGTGKTPLEVGATTSDGRRLTSYIVYIRRKSGRCTATSGLVRCRRPRTWSERDGGRRLRRHLGRPHRAGQRALARRPTPPSGSATARSSRPAGSAPTVKAPTDTPAIFASTDRGETWELRYLSLAEREWDGLPGETRGWYIAELTPGVLTASVLWTDRTDPADPWVHPVTQGLLGMRVYQLSLDRRWTDLARTPADRPVATPGRIVDRPGHRARGRRPRPAVRALEGAPRSGTGSAGGVAAPVERRRSDLADRCARGPPSRTTPSTTGTSGSTRHPDDGRLVNMFWTRDVAAALDIDIHIAWGSPDGRTWTVPVGTGLPGQHCQPISLGGDRLLAVYSHRGDPPGIRAALSEDFGRTWDRANEIVVWASDAGGEPGAGRPRTQDEYWNDMGAWQFGHPRGAAPPRWRGARDVLRRQRRDEERALGATSGVSGPRDGGATGTPAPDAAAARGAGRRCARCPARNARRPRSATAASRRSGTASTTSGAEVIELAGRWVCPGLMNAHSHLCLDGGPDPGGGAPRREPDRDRAAQRRPARGGRPRRRHHDPRRRADPTGSTSSWPGSSTPARSSARGSSPAAGS